MKKHNIMLVIDSLSGGGAELVVANLCRNIDRKRFNVTTCVLKKLNERGEDLQKAGYDVIELPKSQYRIGKYLSSLMLRRIVRDKKIDLIHSHSTHGLIDGGILKFFNRKVRHVHTFHFGNYPHISKKMLVLEMIFSRMPDKLVAVGREQREIIAKVFFHPKKRIETVWNGIEVHETDSNYVQKTGEINLDNGRIILGSISTLIEQKGLTYLLDAISLLSKRRRDFVLWIVGDGPLRDELIAKSNSLGLDQVVKFVGWVDNAPAVILPKMDIFVQSSLWEAMSMVILEAMGAGKAVLATDVGDNTHIIESGKTGIIVKKKDIVGMVEKLEELIRDEKLRKDLGMEGRARILKDCSVEQMARNYEKLYLDVLSRKK